MIKVMSGKVPPTLMAKSSLNQSHFGKLNIPTHSTDLFKSSLVYCDSALSNSLPDSLRLSSSTETFELRYNCLFIPLGIQGSSSCDGYAENSDERQLWF